MKLTIGQIVHLETFDDEGRLLCRAAIVEFIRREDTTIIAHVFGRRSQDFAYIAADGRRARFDIEGWHDPAQCLDDGGGPL